MKTTKRTPAAPDATPSADDYVLGRTSAEYQRLRVQARAWEPATRRVLEQASLKEGMTCLDVGCGPGEVMRLMGEAVGPAGRVTGLDTNGALGREMLGVLQATAPGRFAFVEGDVEAQPAVPGAPFDLVFARLTLIHLKDPVAALRTMGAWTKPGGVVVAQDYDLSGVKAYPPIEAEDAAMRISNAVFARARRDVAIGCKLPLLFAEAGLGTPDGTDVAGLLTPSGPMSAMVQAVLRSVLPPALRMELTTEAGAPRSLTRWRPSRTTGGTTPASGRC